MSGGGLTKEQARARLEDLEFMADTGECLTGACRRLGLNVAALEKWLRDRGRGDLYNRLSAREYHDNGHDPKNGNRMRPIRRAA